MKHTECKDCKWGEGDCGYHFKMDGITDYDIPRQSSCDQYDNCMFFQQKPKVKRSLQSKWTPVSEGLPEIGVDVIVTDIETTGTYSAYYLGDGFWQCDNGTYNNRIIAWMPFPEPYKEEGTEE